MTISTDSEYTMPSAAELLAMEQLVATLPPSTRTNAKGKPTGYKRALWKGLYVFVTPQGAKSFRFGYKAADESGVIREQLHTLALYHPGTYNVSQALTEHARLRGTLGRGKCIRVQREERKEGAAKTFKTWAAEWLDNRRVRLKPKTANNYESLLATYLKPLHGEPLAEITPPMCLHVCQVPAAAGKAHAAKTCARIIREVFTRAINVGPYAGGNPATNTHKELPKGQKRNLAALRVPAIGQFFSDLNYFAEGRRIAEQTALGIELQMHIFVRPSILRESRFDWLKLDAPLGPVLAVPAFTEGTKQRTDARNVDEEGGAYVPFFVPLSPQVLAIIERLRDLARGSNYLFPKRGSIDEPMSEKSLLHSAQMVLGWDGKIKDKADPYYRPRITMHGMRSLFSTGMRDKALRTAAGLGPLVLEDSEAIELQMDHKVNPSDGSAEVAQSYYRGEGDSHRTLRLIERHTIMCQWSTILETAKRDAPVRTLPPNPKRASVAQHLDARVQRSEARA